MYILEPTFATGTICPFSILGAPHTISKISLLPKSIEVTFNLSASGCFIQSKTFPATTPLSPPFTDSKVESFSTSRPKFVNISDISSALEKDST